MIATLALQAALADAPPGDEIMIDNSDPEFSTAAPHTIYHANGTTTVTTDQTKNEGEWIQLGTYELQPGQNHRVVLDNNAPGSWVFADVMRFVREPDPNAVDIVVDNVDPGAVPTGSWATHDYTGGGYFRGANYHQQVTRTLSDKFTWTPTLPQSGRYRVYTRWVQNTAYASDVTYSIHHAGGVTEVDKNQQNSGGQWIPLGVYDLMPGQSHRVELRQNGVDLKAVADAIRFVRVGDVKLVTADAARFVRNDAEPVQYVLWDNLFAPRKLVDGSGAVSWDLATTPYGAEESQLGTALMALRFPVT